VRLGDALKKLRGKAEAAAACAKAMVLVPPPAAIQADTYVKAAVAMVASVRATATAWIGLVSVAAFAAFAWS
jgi:hypothetical protein